MKQNKFMTLFLLMLCVLALSACAGRNAMNNSQSWPGITADGDTVYAANGNMIEAVKDGRICKGDKVCLVGFGGGLTYGAVIFEY